MRIVTIPVGAIGTNCYLLISEGGHCYIIDPGAEAERIEARIEMEKVEPQGILLTHGHFDHIGAVDALKEKYGVKVFLGTADWRMSINPEQNASAAFGGPDVTAVPDEFLDGGETLMLDELRIEVLKTPGHSRGGICFYIPDQYTLFSGDTLFCGGYGRCDLYGGDYAALMRSLSELMRLPEQCRVYPGHGGETTILREKIGGLI